MERLLPIGSIVELKDALGHLFMVMGYLPQVEGDIYTYIGVVYPNGLLSKNSAFVFNIDAIEKTVFSGYRDEEGEAFTTAVPLMMEAVGRMMEEAGPKETLEEEGVLHG